MEQDTRRLSDLARILLVVAVLVTAVATHYLDTHRVFRVEDLTATEMTDTLKWLDTFYRSPEGLQRPTGIIANGDVDYESISNWLFRNYLQARAQGATAEDAREIVAKHIRESPEWQEKHKQ
ncbi:MAG TPA: hypothetical protein VF456_23440 [Vicinamibacterales bacterium]